MDGRNEKIGYKIREARNQRDPYLLIIGEREEAAGTVSVRSSKEGELGEMSVEVLIAKMKHEIESKAY